MLYSWVSEPLRLMVVDRWVPTRSAEICGQGVVQRHHEFMVVVRPCPWWDFKRRLQAALLVLSSPPDAQLGILLAVSLLRHLVIGALIQQYFTRCPLLSLRIIWSFSLRFISWPVEDDVPFLKWKKFESMHYFRYFCTVKILQETSHLFQQSNPAKRRA